METWQNKHINTHLPKLLKFTNCDDLFLAILQSKDILSSADTERIKIEKTWDEKASLLYKIIVTRTNSYNILLSALVETKQSGAHSILSTKFMEFHQIGNLEFNKEKRLGGISGSGDFKYYEGKFSNRDIAIRRERCTWNSEYATSRLKREIELLTKLDYQENILRYFTCKIDDDLEHVLLVFELFNSTLEDYVRDKTQKQDEATKKSILKQLTSALCFIHGNKIIYLNLRHSSILISEVFPSKLRIKFSNFSSAVDSPAGISNVIPETLMKNKDWLPGDIQQSMSDTSNEICVVSRHGVQEIHRIQFADFYQFVESNTHTYQLT